LAARYTSVEERHAIEAEAARRYLEARSGDRAEDWDAALAWVSENPAHGVAFAKAEASWELTARLREVVPRLEPEAIAGPAGRFEALFTERAVAALLGIAVIGTAATIGIQKWSDVDRHYTMIGEERELALADGSRVYLNTDSVIEVRLRGSSRLVRLLKGEARFDVAHDPSRSFVVQASDATLRALGTDFNVRLRPDLTELTVISGRVAVRDGEAPTRTVDAGTAAAIRNGAVALTHLERGQIARRVAWQSGIIEFRGETLGQVVEELNRYRTAPLVIGDSQLASIAITGTVRADRADRFVAALERRHGIRAIVGTDGAVMLLPADPTAAGGGNRAAVR
jgi:transmembrane sensor